MRYVVNNRHAYTFTARRAGKGRGNGHQDGVGMGIARLQRVSGLLVLFYVI